VVNQIRDHSRRFAGTVPILLSYFDPFKPSVLGMIFRSYDRMTTDRTDIYGLADRFPWSSGKFVVSVF